MATRLARLLLLCGALTIPAGVAACGSELLRRTRRPRRGARATPRWRAEEAGSTRSCLTARSPPGWPSCEEMGAAVVAGTGAGSGSVEDVDEMYEKWDAFEGTIKENKVDLYLTMEDSMASLRSAVEEGDTAAGDRGHGRAVRGLRRVPGRAPLSCRCDRARALLAIGVAAVALVLLVPGRATAAGGVTRDDAIAELQDVRISIDETLALFKAGRDAEAFEKARSGYLNHFEAGRDPAAGRRPHAHRRGRGVVRRGPPARRAASVGRGGAGQGRGAAWRHRRRRASAHLGQRGRGGHRRRPVLPHHLPRGPRGRPAPVGAARLPGVGEGRPVPPADAGGRRSGRRWRRWPPSSRCRPSSPPSRPAASCSRPSPRSSPWPCSSTCRSG